MMRKVSCLGFGVLLAAGPVAAQAQSKSREPRVVRYHATMAEVKYIYGVARPPTQAHQIFQSAATATAAG